MSESFAFLQTVASTNDDYHVCESGVIGRRGSPLSWGRGASFLGRPGLALLETTELPELVVDTPCKDHDRNDGELSAPADVETMLSDLSAPSRIVRGRAETPW